MAYQRGQDGGLSAAELDGVLASLTKLSQIAVISDDHPQMQRFGRGMAAGYRLSVQHIASVVGWHCSAGETCDQAALFVDADGQRFCNDHLPDDQEALIAEHDDQREAIDNA